jgi:hypothetical protein
VFEFLAFANAWPVVDVAVAEGKLVGKAFFCAGGKCIKWAEKFQTNGILGSALLALPPEGSHHIYHKLEKVTAVWQ